MSITAIQNIKTPQSFKLIALGAVLFAFVITRQSVEQPVWRAQNGKASKSTMDEKFLSLPWEIQIALGSGYLAYALAYLGIKDHHKPIDTAFRTIAFGLCATSVLALLPATYGFWRVTAAVLTSLVSGALWRYWFADGVQWLIRKADLSWSDETPSAWSKITLHNNRTYVSQVSVQLDDDSWLFCDDTRQFAESPYGPCVLGSNGDVAIYATHKCRPGEDIVPDADVRDPYHGDKLTYVPAGKIRRVSLRMLKNPNGSVEVAAVSPVAEAEAP